MRDVVSILKVLCALTGTDITYIENFRKPLWDLLHAYNYENLKGTDLVAKCELNHPATKKLTERNGTKISEELARIVQTNANNPEFLKYFNADSVKDESPYVEQEELVVAQKLTKLSEAFKGLYQTSDLAVQEQKVKELISIVSEIKIVMNHMTQMNQNGKIIKFI
jgi:hypothetical protein